MKVFGLASFILFLPLFTFANEANILDAKVRCNEKRICTFWITIKHQDSGWEHYANSFEILKEDGTLLKRRILTHPHVKEQPFTRSVQGVKLHKDITHVIIRARDSRHKYGGKTIKVAIP
jgi:bacillopeptidase F (M6 metalloprotease family)